MKWIETVVNLNAVLKGRHSYRAKMWETFLKKILILLLSLDNKKDKYR